MARDKTINMTEGPISKLMIRFALPVFFMSLFNQLYLITDSLIIATFTGDLGLGAVTNCENIYWFVTSFFWLSVKACGISEGFALVGSGSYPLASGRNTRHLDSHSPFVEPSLSGY